MKGRNELRLCEAAMIDAMQDWADNMTLDANVTGVRAIQENGSLTFIVILDEPTPPVKQ